VIDRAGDDFSEFIVEAHSVFLNTKNQSQTGHKSVTYFETKDENRAIDILEGTVYVMNEAGSTIAKYDLGYGFPVESGKQ
jgi:hypothetical protein